MHRGSPIVAAVPLVIPETSSNNLTGERPLRLLEGETTSAISRNVGHRGW